VTIWTRSRARRPGARLVALRQAAADAGRRRGAGPGRLRGGRAALPTDDTPDRARRSWAPAESSLARALEIRETSPPPGDAWWSAHQRHRHGHRDRRPGVERLLAARAHRPHRHHDRRSPGGRSGGPEASVEATRELASVGVAGVDGLDRIRQERARIEEAEQRRPQPGGRDAAYARFEELARTPPSEAEDVIADYEAERRPPGRGRRQRSERAARPPVEPEPSSPPSRCPPPPSGSRTARRVAGAAAAVEWWFGRSRRRRRLRPVKALAERLSAEGREAWPASKRSWPPSTAWSWPSGPSNGTRPARISGAGRVVPAGHRSGASISRSRFRRRRRRGTTGAHLVVRPQHRDRRPGRTRGSSGRTRRRTVRGVVEAPTPRASRMSPPARQSPGTAGRETTTG